MRLGTASVSNSAPLWEQLRGGFVINLWAVRNNLCSSQIQIIDKFIITYLCKSSVCIASPNAGWIPMHPLPFKLIPVSCLTSIKGIRVIRKDMGEKEGILQFVFHSLMIRQQPRHVACLECLSLHSGHESYCVRREKKGIYVAISAHIHTDTHTRISKLCLSVCFDCVCGTLWPQVIVKKGEKEASRINDPPVDLCCYSGFTRTPRRTWFWFPWFIAVQKHTVMVLNLKLCFPIAWLRSSLSSTLGHRLQLSL